MKKLLSLFLAISFTLFCCVSCSGGETNVKISSNPPLISVSDSVSLNIYRPPVGSFIQFDGIEAWEKLIEEKYSVSIKINYISPLHQSAIATATYYNQAIKNGDIAGMIELNISDFPNLGVLKDEGLILPLDDFLAENSAYHELPESMKSAFKLSDGQTWALSVSSPSGIAMRNFRKSWLDALGLQAPQTLDELYEVSKAFAYDDPNGNGKSDEHGMDINFRTGARMLNDIFLANGCYLSNYTACSISYDYLTGAYEDAALKPGMLDTLQYIKQLHENGILHMSPAWKFRETDGFGNFYDLSIFNGNLFNVSEWVSVYTLSETEGRRVLALKPQKCYVLTSNTEDPEATINSFVNLFMADMEGMALGTLGVPEINYRFEGDKLIHLFESSNSQGSDFYNNNLWLTGLNFAMIGDSKTVVESSYFSDEYLASAVVDMRKYNELYMNNMIFTDSWFLPHPDYKAVQRTFGMAMYNFFMEIDSISPEDYINNYINSAKKAGADKILDDLNEDAGTLATFNY